MSGTYRAQVRAAVRAVEMAPDGGFSWFGIPTDPPQAPTGEPLPAAMLAGWQLAALQRRLYEDFYLPGGAVASRPRSTAGHDATSLRAALDAANQGAGSWEPGWQVLALADDRVVVRRDELTLWLDRDQCRPLAAGEVVPGGQVELRMPAALPNHLPGFYLALSDVHFAAGPNASIVRLYWNLLPEGAPLLVERATALLNGAGIPYQLKVLADPVHYDRCDAAILYVDRGDLPRAAATIATIQAVIAPYLKPAVPALTKRLAPGLGLADDPGGGESFGGQRCRLLAQAIVETWQAGYVTFDDRIERVLNGLAEAGVRIDAPYLSPGSSDDFPTLPVRPARRRRPAPTNADRCLQTAGEIGQRLVASAIWHADRCTWLAVEDDSAPATIAGVGPDLYGGTSGIALFLGELAAISDDPDARRTALGALRQAIAHAADIPDSQRFGLFTGPPGIALVAAWLARGLAEPALLDDARHLLAALDPTAPGEHDLLAGAAGGVIALTLLHRLLADDRLLELATLLGDRLLDAAIQDETGLTWPAAGRRLTGLAHGASGIGSALLELANAGGERRFHDAALAAFSWERGWLDEAAGNWPDLRRVRLPVPSGVALPFASGWCHGAPGIALSRLRVWRLLGDGRLEREARRAIETTGRWVEQALGDPGLSRSLCHGLAGNAEILRAGGQAFGDDRLCDVARVAADAGIDQAPSDRPGLMLGLAGAGRFYLRLARPELPSILLPVAE